MEISKKIGLRIPGREGDNCSPFFKVQGDRLVIFISFYSFALIHLVKMLEAYDVGILFTTTQMENELILPSELTVTLNFR